MQHLSVFHRTIPLAFFLLSLPLFSFSQAFAPRGPRTAIPAAPIYSRDGSVVIKAPATMISFRSPILLFVERVREELTRATHLKFEPQNGLIEVMIGNKTDGDTRVLLTRFRDDQGGDRERITLPDPAHADLRKVRRAVCIAFLRLWVVDIAVESGSSPQNIPMWLIDGVIRYLDREGRQQDVDRTLRLWSHACLPPAKILFAEESAATASEPAVGAVLASWFMDRKSNVLILENVLRNAALGRPWTPQAAARMLAQTEDMVQFDAEIDRRMLGERRVVKLPGLTTADIVTRFRSELFLYPDSFMETRGRGYTFQDAAALYERVEIRQIALRQAERIRIAVLGRDPQLMNIATAYEIFLRALGRGGKPGELSKLLLNAESLRHNLESRVSTGEILQHR